MTQVISLRKRLLLGFVPVLIIITGAMTVLAHHLAEDIFYRNVDRILRAHLRGLHLAMEHCSDPNERQLLVTKILADISNPRPALFRIQSSNPNTPILTNADPNSLIPCIPPTGQICSVIYQGQEYRQMVSHELGASQSYTITLSFCIETLHNDLQQLLTTLLSLAFLAVILAIGLSIASVYWALFPINQMGRHLQTLCWDTVENQTDLQKLTFPTELAPFQQALDQMLSRLTRFVDRHRQFSRNAAHELRTPIALAKSTLQGALYESHNEEDYRKIIGESLSALDRMTDLIEQLLLLCFLGETPNRTTFDIVDIDIMLREAIATHCTQAQYQGPEQDVSLETWGNAPLLQCLWANLLDNACKFAPTSPPIKVITSVEGMEISVQIRDHGTIAPEELPHLKECFYRIEKSRNRKHGGCGLGLTIAHDIVKHHRGKLNITSTPTQGTCVEVRLHRHGIHT